MTHDQPARERANKLTTTADGVLDAQAVKAEAAQPEPLRPIPWNGIQRGRLGNGGMEASVEGRHLGHTR